MKTALVTGSNRGIGLEFCKQLTLKGMKVIALCRKASAELRSLDVLVIEGVDVRLPESLEKARGQIENTPVDLLINNAGIFTPDSYDDFGSISEHFEVNAVGPLKATKAFLPLLKEGAKIAMISSFLGSISKNSSGGYYGYRMSKAALNMAAVSLSYDFKEKGIAVAIFHPGYVITDMTSRQGSITPQTSVSGMLKVIDQLNLDSSGTFWNYEGKVVPW